MNEKLMDYLRGFESKYPHNLEARFPRIVEKIVRLWDTPEINNYFSDLLIDDRGNRQGFPPEIAREIFQLSSAHDEIQARLSVEGDVWADERRVAKEGLEQLGVKLVPAAMIRTAEAGDPSRMLLFLKAGMPVDTRDEREWTPLMVAAFSGNEAVAQLLIQHGANIQARDRGGYTPMHWAALNGYQNVVRLLIGKGVERNIQSNYGWTPLLQAAAKGHAAVAADLLDAGADPNLASHDGWTPLHKAVANGHRETVALLLKYGASILARHQDGSTPLSLAQKGTRPEILELFLSRVRGEA